MKLYLIRHGEVHNPNQVLYGRLPGFGLSALGKKQAQQTGEELKNRNITALYTSPLLRARQTAIIIGAMLNLKSRTSTLLTESGVLPQGKPLSYFKKIEPDLYADRYVSRGQESIDHMRKRLLRFVAFIQKKHANQIVAAVFHGDPILTLKAWYENKPFTYSYKVANMISVGGVIELHL